MWSRSVIFDREALVPRNPSSFLRPAFAGDKDQLLLKLVVEFLHLTESVDLIVSLFEFVSVKGVNIFVDTGVLIV